MNTLYFSKEFSQELMHPEMQVDIKLNIINECLRFLSVERRFLGLQTSTALPLYPVMRIQYPIMAFCFFSL